ncbi:hypothetical protein J132_08343 [Termitomyces sp. J132]|nr:hypothetical protein J132_08343 [Termitomyces sp. J132]
MGEFQAQATGEVWKTKLATRLPVPGKFYVSLLLCALKTLEIMFSGLFPECKSDWVTVFKVNFPESFDYC